MAQSEKKNVEEVSDQPVLHHIERLIAEEHRLYTQPTATEDDRARLAKLQVELDQCWDLLRQRQALREFGRDPKEAHVRLPEVVEDYEG
jgi:hypothetical protein